MPVGLQTFDADGNVMIDTTTRTGTLLGVFNTGKSNGSRTDPSLAMGTPFWSITSNEDAYAMFAPVIDAGLIDGAHRIKWTFKESGSPYNSDFRVIYGVY